MGAHGGALGARVRVHVHVRVRETKEREWRRDEDERGWRGWGWTGDDRSLEPHGRDNTFWRYKNECFSHPYLRGDSAKPRATKARKEEKEREKERERERNNEREGEREASLFSRGPFLQRRVAFLPRGKRREKVPRSQSTMTAFFGRHSEKNLRCIFEWEWELGREIFTRYCVRYL